MRIIVFEDDKSMAGLLEQVLVQLGHDVQVFPDPTCCPVYSEHRARCPKSNRCADVIISDYMMPHMTGLEFYKFQRKAGCKAPDCNKALVTATVLDEAMQRDMEELGCHYIRKPFRLADVVKWVGECAERLAAPSG